VRLEADATGIRVTTRAVLPIEPLSLVLAATRHQPYPHKITARTVFDAALAEARAAGVDDALLATPDGLVAEGTAWNIFWWEGDRPATPSLSLGILPGVGRRRVMELTSVVERSCRPSELAGHSLFATNAVRGVIPIARVGQRPVPVDARTEELGRRFWAA
jgi:branched-subunit amino acid aminotransferase/4-amino-4-deoxychorismate lyase